MRVKNRILYGLRIEGRTDEKKPFSLLDAARLFNDDAF